MFGRPRSPAPWFVLALAALGPFAATPCRAASLDPASAELARPALDPAADAEVIRYDVRIVDGVIGLDFDRAIEINRATMVYTARGAEAEGAASIPYGLGTQVEFVSVRVTTPDGRKRNLTPEKMIDQEVARAGVWTLRRRSFVVPGLVPGSLVEVHSRVRVLSRDRLLDLKYPCQEDVPIRSFRLRIRPWKELTYVLRTNAALRPAEPITTDAEGYRTVVLRDLPAWHAEPWMPDFEAVCPIVWGEYIGGSAISSLVIRLTGRIGSQDDLRSTLPVVDSVLAIATAVVQGATSSAERAERLFRYCRTRLRNLTAAADSAGTTVRRNTEYDDLSPWTTLRNRANSSLGINLAFAGLAVAAGLDVRLVLADRDASGWFGEASSVDLDDVSRVFVALSGPGGWQLFDPGDAVQPQGFVAPSFEGCTVFLASGGKPVPFVLPRMPASRSREERLAELRLSPEGDAAGTLRVRWTGHVIGQWLDRIDGLAGDERRDRVLEGLLRRWPAAQVDSFAFAASDDGLSPAGWRCRVRIPAYASIVGNVLLAPLDPFEELHVETLAHSLRRHPVHWAYSWTEWDRTRLTPPAGARIVLPSVPGETGIPSVFRGSCLTRATGAAGEVEFERTAEYTRPAAGDLARERWAELRSSIEASQAHGRLVAEVSLPASVAKP